MSSGRLPRAILTWCVAVLTAFGGLAALVAVIDPANGALWVWTVAAVVLLAAREAYARYLRDESPPVDRLDLELEDR